MANIFSMQNMATGMPVSSIMEAGNLSGRINTAPQNEPVVGIQGGLTSAMDLLAPHMQGTQQAYDRFQNELFGNPTATQNLPGYGSMVSARGDAIDDLVTGRAGFGKLFSGSTGEAAADIGGSMEQNLRNNYLNMLMGETQAGRNLATQGAGMQMGGAQSIANILMGQEQMQAAQNQANADRKTGFWGDLLGAAGTVGGFLLGGPAGAGIGAGIGTALGGPVVGGGGSSSNYVPGSL